MRRSLSYAVIFLIYLVAFGVGYLTFKLLNIPSYTIKIIICDIVATLFVWLMGVILKNSSVYDPYWSVAPLVIIPLFIKQLDLPSILLLTVVFIWGIRLTLNWAYTFKNLQWQDWRYTYFKEKFPRGWHFINLTGINLMPTIIVISVMLPAFKFLEDPKFNIITIIGIAISLFGISCEFFADLQMHRFKKQGLSTTINTGLWKYSRHPNYLGEILMWWGIFIIALSGKVSIFYIIGPILNTLLFIVISIPLIEKRLLETKRDYRLYQQTTSKLLLLPPKKR